MATTRSAPAAAPSTDQTDQTDPTGPASSADPADPTDHADRNRVILDGRVSGRPERRALPSGDEVVDLRVVVHRPDEGHDTVPVQVGPGPGPGRRAAAGQVGRRQLAAAEQLEPGTRVEVVGTLRRRWWATPAGRRSRIEVHATALRPAPT